jgi:predicted TIM-barrel fold metal-dependent hydrolase
MGLPMGLRFRGRSFGAGSDCVCHSRRQVLAGAGAAVAAALLPAVARGQVASPAVRSIDVHHHIYPPRYQADNFQRIVENIGPGSAAVSANWSPSRAVEKMDQAGVAVAINSMSSPGVWFDDGEAGRVRARECNEFGAQMIGDFPGRFGMFAAIPLPDTEGSLREIEHAFEVLKFDGVGVLTSYAGKLLGDPQFAPVFDELNRRKAVVFVHPTTSCCTNPIPGVSPIIIEFPMDTTRSILSLLMSGTFARCPDVRFIFAHGGGMLTSIANRIGRAAEAMKAEDKPVKLPKGPQYELERQYYDVASIGLNPPAMAALRKLMPTSQLLFGSDEPFLSSAQTGGSLQKLGFSADELQAIQRNNALRLFPRFQT